MNETISDTMTNDDSAILSDMMTNDNSIVVNATNTSDDVIITCDPTAVSIAHIDPIVDGEPTANKKQAVRAKRVSWTKEICAIALFTVLTCVLSQVSFPLPMNPIPFSLGMVAIYMCGLMLRPLSAATSQICYLLLGIAGAPVFSGGRGGVGHFVGPTGGCLMAYPIMALIISLLLNSRLSLFHEQNSKKYFTFIKASIALTASLALIYFMGAFWMMITLKLSFAKSMMLVCVPYVAFDVIKIVVVVVALVPLRFSLIKTDLLLLNQHRISGYRFR